MKHLLRVAVTLAIFYAIGVFIAWDLNPGHWELFGRFMLVVIAAIVATIIYTTSRNGDLD